MAVSDKTTQFSRHALWQRLIKWLSVFVLMTFSVQSFASMATNCHATSPINHSSSNHDNNQHRHQLMPQQSGLVTDADFSALPGPHSQHFAPHDYKGVRLGLHADNHAQQRLEDTMASAHDCVADCCQNACDHNALSCQCTTVPSSLAVQALTQFMSVLQLIHVPALLQAAVPSQLLNPLYRPPKTV